MRIIFIRPLIVLAVMLASTALAIWLEPSQVLAETEPLDLQAIIPKSFSGWNIDPNELPIPLTPEVKAMIDRTYDQVLERTYVGARGQRIMLSMAYARHAERSILHRPEVCYPAQGFLIEQASQSVQLMTQVGAIDAAQLVARRGLRSEPITYWVVVGREQTQFGTHMRILQVKRGLVGVIPDGLLVRVSSIGQEDGVEFATQHRFIEDLVKVIDKTDLSKIVGVTH